MNIFSNNKVLYRNQCNQGSVNLENINLIDLNEHPKIEIKEFSANSSQKYFESSQNNQRRDHNYFIIKPLFQQQIKIDQSSQSFIDLDQESDQKIFQELFEQYQMETIQLDNQLDNYSYDYLLLFNHSQFYYKSNSFSYYQLSKNIIQLIGKLYDLQLDLNNNPSFLIQQGKFVIFLENKKFNLIGFGVEYCGKSKIKKYEGEFENGKYKQNELNKIIFQGSQSAPIRKIFIYDVQNGNLINKDHQNQNKQYEEKQIENWVKYNQQISTEDVKILKQNGRLTSSIIDSYVFYLNLQSENEYFTKVRDKSRKIYKLLLLTTALTTNFGENYTFQKAKDLFEEELLQFQEINYEIKKIYQQVGFPINKYNNHWYFILFDLNINKCLIFDSLINPNSFYNYDKYLIQTLQQLLKIQLLEIQLSQYSGQQIDNYSCGYHVCQFMKYCQKVQFQVNKKYSYVRTKIVKHLEKIIAKNDTEVKSQKQV
ncbi:unnamed protein product [Paramecium sonneborni]|uniref:Ubiquitin-like protease family profile domain-containing protein n=1 Tax=Paramecium sonneborni TaxID=65129 RepID=A0A8S1MLT0_9CILI|nr:unnamed protein product [Paramecium sonneborni]